MGKQILFNEEARTKLKNGVDAVADAVRITLGPRGRNVVLDKGYGSPTITNDGVSIAREISLSDKFENMGVEIIKEVASKTNDLAGDGTTTAMVLTQAIIAEGMKRTAMGANAMGVRLGIEDAARDVIAGLKEMAKPIKGQDAIKQVASISAESEELGKIIAETIEKVGKDGVVTVEESQSLGIESDVVEGMEFDQGYVSPYMITNTERMEAEFKDASILITDKKISAINDILPLLEKLAQSGKKDLVIIADDVEGEALATFVVNKLRGAFNVLAIKAPGFGDEKKAMLQDIAVTVGGTVISEEVGLKLDAVELDVLGKAGRIVATKDKTIVVDGKGNKKVMTERVAQLKKQLELEESSYGKEKVQKRIAKLAGGVAVVRVGAPTETEMKYLKDKIDDAVNATKAAIEEGIIPGGGTALTKISYTLRTAAGKKKEFLNQQEIANSEYAIGYVILLDALTAPLKQIAVNAGEDGAVVVRDVEKEGNEIGYDAAKNEHVDMFKSGIIDPVKVTRSGVQHAASAAAIFLTSEVAITDEPKEEGEASMGGGMPGGMGGGMPGMGF